MEIKAILKDLVSRPNIIFLMKKFLNTTAINSEIIFTNE